MKNKQTNMIIAKTADERNLFCSEKQKKKKKKEKKKKEKKKRNHTLRG
jgi:hypothetical protein